nr:Os05g0573950 [Ipomoea batatas]
MAGVRRMRLDPGALRHHPAPIAAPHHPFILVLPPPRRHAMLPLQEVGVFVHQRNIPSRRRPEPAALAVVSVDEVQLHGKFLSVVSSCFWYWNFSLAIIPGTVGTLSRTLTILRTLIPSSSHLSLNLRLPTLGPAKEKTETGILVADAEEEDSPSPWCTTLSFISAMSYALNRAKAAPRLCPVTVMLRFSPLYLSIKEVEETGLDFDVGVVAEMGGVEDVLEVVDPLQVGDGATPRDDDVATPQPSDLLLVRGDSDVAHPVRVLAPDPVHAGVLEEVGEVNVGGRVKVAADPVPAARHAQLVEELGAVVLAGAAVLGVRVEVEGVVAGLGELAVPNDFAAKMGVHELHGALMAAAERETLHFREYGFWGDNEGCSSVKGKTKELEGLVMFINGGAKPSEKMWLREIWRDPIMSKKSNNTQEQQEIDQDTAGNFFPFLYCQTATMKNNGKSTE